MHRLQGKEFQDKKKELTMLGYQVSNEGNIRAIMRLKKAKQVHIGGSTKYMYSHWLNPQEAETFRQSTYFKINKPITNEALYAQSIEREKEYQERCAKRQEKYNSLPSELIDGIKKLKGLPPYENKRLSNGEVIGTNYCEGDGYFSKYLEDKFGIDDFNLAYDMTN